MPTINQPIHKWAEDDRPRLKLLSHGRSACSDSELLAILINTGTIDKNAVELAKEILRDCDYSIHKFAKKSISDLCKYKGIGEAKAMKLVAAMELGRRRKLSEREQKRPITSPRHSYEILRPLLEDQLIEKFYVLYLNRANRLIKHSLISIGGVSEMTVDPRVIFKEAVDYLACSIVLAHNHPSGQLKPSSQDIRLTKKIVAMSEIMEIQVLDHLILTDNSYFSFADKGMI
ncbi:MAG: JAB domain-containing protein [Bacteroidetes bacterium]|nr:MAG: JAB domain-containing protein [Bacteroidota bacterium]